MHLKVGEQKKFIIDSKLKWNSTELSILPTEEYYFEATGTWKDAGIECTADGYSYWALTIATVFRRSFKNKWFALIGTVDKSGRKYLIGRENNIKFCKAGKLYFYANDLIFMYWNNLGAIELTIKRVS
jgi:hypothetical protein